MTGNGIVCVEVRRTRFGTRVCAYGNFPKFTSLILILLVLSTF